MLDESIGLFFRDHHNNHDDDHGAAVGCVQSSTLSASHGVCRSDCHPNHAGRPLLAGVWRVGHDVCLSGHWELPLGGLLLLRCGGTHRHGPVRDPRNCRTRHYCGAGHRDETTSTTTTTTTTAATTATRAKTTVDNRIVGPVAATRCPDDESSFVPPVQPDF